jgi:hypothetical protein
VFKALQPRYVAVGGDEEAEAAAREVCAEAEITTIVADAAPAAPPVYLSATPRWGGHAGPCIWLHPPGQERAAACRGTTWVACPVPGVPGGLLTGAHSRASLEPCAASLHALHHPGEGPHPCLQPCACPGPRSFEKWAQQHQAPSGQGDAGSDSKVAVR